jgi:hypothetical protein
MVVVIAEDFAWKTTDVAANGCGVPSPVVRPPYI